MSLVSALYVALAVVGLCVPAAYVVGRLQTANERVDQILQRELARPAINDQAAADRAEAGDHR